MKRKFERKTFLPYDEETESGKVSFWVNVLIFGFFAIYVILGLF